MALEAVGKKVLVRPISLADSADILECMRRGDISDAVPGSESITGIATAREMVAGLIQRAADGAEFHFAVCLKGGRAIGMAALYGFDGQGSATIGYWIGVGHRGMGYGTEAVRLLCSIGFERMGLARVYATSGSSNGASLRLLESLGFRRVEGNQKNSALLFRLEPKHD